HRADLRPRTAGVDQRRAVDQVRASFHEGRELGGLVADVAFDQLALALLQRERVGAFAVERYDLVAVGAELLCQMRAEETRATRQEDTHVVSAKLPRGQERFRG